MSTVMDRIEAGEKQIADVFSDGYAFTIPPYQRPYAWEVQQANELLDDLLEAMRPNSRSEGLYFLGSIVLVKTRGNSAAKVVDGQQRLTTLTILFSVLRDLTDDFELKIDRENMLSRPQIAIAACQKGCVCICGSAIRTSLKITSSAATQQQSCRGLMGWKGARRA